MIDRLTADTQRWLSYGYFIGYFCLKVLEGMKLLSPVSGIDELALLIGYFWFQRERSKDQKTSS